MSDMPPDPFTYIGRLARDDSGKAISMEIFHPGDDGIRVEQGDEFVTFTTVIEL